MLNEYFFTVFTQENMQDIPDSEQIFRAEESEKLIDITVTKEKVEQEMDQKSSNQQDSMKFFLEYLSNPNILLMNR